MATVEEDLTQLEKDIRQVKIEYEQYFGGGRKRPPQDTVWRIETLLKKYSEMGGRVNFALRFRISNLAQTFAKYQDIWRKKLKAKEEGVVQRHFGAAAKAIEAERAKAHVAEVAAEQAAAAAPPAGAAAKRAAAAQVMAFSDPEREADKVRQFYDQLMEAKQKAGEKTDSLSLDSFQQFVRQKTAQLKEKGAKEVEYAISLEGGQVKLKARVKS